jgi:hypothetical protein
MWDFRRVVVALVGLMALALVAPWGAPKAVADGDRLGCNTYCQNAGGYGATGDPAPPRAVTIVSTTVTADADGYVPVTLACNTPTQCSGYLSVSAVDNGLIGGRSDLLVNAGATRTIAIPSGPDGIAFLRSHGPWPFFLTIDDGPGGGGFGVGKLTVAPPG